MSAGPGNPHYNVGGTAQDGGLSTADTVRDGGTDGGNREADSPFVPSSGGAASGGGNAPQTRSKTGGITEKVDKTVKQTSQQIKQSIPNYGMESNKSKEAHVGNPNRNVGGTAKDGGISTADTVADGGPDDAEEDEDFKP